MDKFKERTVKLESQTITLREIAPTDAQSLIQFLSIIGEETTFTYNYPGQQVNLENMMSRLSAEAKSPTSLRVVATVETKIIGQIGFWRHNPDHPWLQHKGEFAMMIVKAWWGSGLAKELIASMEEFARSTGVVRIDATVSCSNERGVALYRKHGYSIEGSAKAYKIVDGKPHDSFFIAKLLSKPNSSYPL